MSESPKFLQEKYKLSSSEEVESAAKRTERRMRLRKTSDEQARLLAPERSDYGQVDEKPPQTPEERVQNYLDRFREIVERKDPHKREQGIEALKTILHDKFVIKPDEVPESYFESIRQRHREEGHGEIEISEELRQEIIEPIIDDQKNSLDIWIDYLASEDAKYPDYLKYWAFRSMLKMGRYDKEKEKFSERYGGTVSPFPELNREALALVFDAMEKKEKGEDIDFGYDIQEDTKQRFLNELNRKNFVKLYGIAIEEFRPISEELLKITDGQWRVFSQNSNPDDLVNSLKNHGTGWCIRGKSTAKRYLDTNNLEVFYSNDKEGNPTVPRVVIVSSQEKISEVRGVEKQENLDAHIGDVVQKKLETLPDGKSYEKKIFDMRRLTQIENKTKEKQELTKDDLIFLYEIDSPIEGFGYLGDQRDPRIKELQKTRNPEEDMPIVFECAPEQIAHNTSEINENTKAYVGKLEKSVFKLIQQYNIEHIYSSFPEKKITRFEVGLGGKSKKELTSELEMRESLDPNDKNKIYISDHSKSMLKNKDFFTLENKEQRQFIKLTVTDLGFPNGVTTKEIYQKAEELGLELCPPETGPQLRLYYEEIFKREQPRGEWFYIGMKAISDSDGLPSVFRVDRFDGGESWLGDNWAGPGLRWDADHVFVFSLRKLKT